MRRSSLGKTRILLVLLALGQLTCNQAIMTAPAGSSLTLYANPTVISSNGGISIISALVVEPAGTVVADGTVVQFFTDLGDIPEQGKTNDGVVRVNLRANGRSGEATITAFSGGDAPVPAPSASATATTSTGSALVSAAAGTAARAATAPIKVTIGNLAAASVFVTADPPRITNSRSTQIRANVFDKSGNPLSGVPVFFDVTKNGDTNYMDSGGAPRFTDSNGQAFDVMRTRAVVSEQATVRARVPVASGATGVFGEVVVEIVLN